MSFDWDSYNICATVEQLPADPASCESKTMPVAIGEHLLFQAEGYDIHVLIEAVEDDGITVELLAVHPHSTMYNGKVLHLLPGETTEFVFCVENKSGEKQNTRVLLKMTGE